MSTRTVWSTFTNVPQEIGLEARGGDGNAIHARVQIGHNELNFRYGEGGAGDPGLLIFNAHLGDAT
jgi:hypothetical protein